jgi:hypothetical protein
MVMQAHWNPRTLPIIMILGLLCGTVHIASAGEDTKGVSPGTKPEQRTNAKKPQAKGEPKAAKPNAGKPTYKSAETANKGNACFGEAPKIVKISPDEGRAGDKITISGTKFGSSECLRSISFGPGHDAAFTMKNETTITTTVPKNGRKGLTLVTVTTASGEDSRTFLLK